jgi:hypothetical protein
LLICVACVTASRISKILNIGSNIIPSTLLRLPAATSRLNARITLRQAEIAISVGLTIFNFGLQFDGKPVTYHVGGVHGVPLPVASARFVKSMFPGDIMWLLHVEMVYTSGVTSA